MNERIAKRIEKIVRKSFYKIYHIVDNDEEIYIINGGIVRENRERSKKNKKKTKKYCATKYMKINDSKSIF